MWIIKENGASPSQKIPGGEVGVYQCFDPENWERQRKQLQVLYTDLEERSTNGPPFQGAGAGAAVTAMGVMSDLLKLI